MADPAPSPDDDLRISEARFRGTFENAAVGIAHCDLEGRWLRVNHTFCAIVGREPDELIGRPFSEITHPEDQNVGPPDFHRLARGERGPYSVEKRYIRHDGGVVWVKLYISLQRDEAGAPAYVIGVLEDVGERKRLECELRRAMEEAEAANRAKDDFLANVSHEMRTPLNAILGMTELTLETPLTEDQRQCLKTVRSAAEGLVRIVDDVLDFAKVAAGKLDVDAAEFSLRVAVGDVLRFLGPRAHAKKLDLVSQVRDDVPDALIGDVGRFRQILINLVGNAVKFTESGEVFVLVELDQDVPEDDPGRVGLRVKVVDTGIGIPRAEQARIFRAFEQQDASTTRRFGGTGLGLTIAAQLAALMGGGIAVQSEPGRGSTFTLTSRFARKPPPRRSHGTRPVGLPRGRWALVVDDNAITRRVLEGWLTAWGLRVTTADGGIAALDALWRAAARKRLPDVVLLDARMPDVDGLDLAAKIRASDELAGTSIIILTTGDEPGDLVRSRELSVAARLLKPIRQDELLDALRGAIVASAPSPPTSASAAAEESDAGGGLSILVAEDDEFNARFLVRLLNRRGWSVRLAADGRQALTLAIDESQAFDMMLLDVHMPELDGFAVVRAVREAEAARGGRRLPIVALTARSRRGDRGLCLAAGMDDYLTKPIRTDRLFATIEQLTAGRSAFPGDSPALDPNALLAACGGDADLLAGLCRDFRELAPARLHAARDALRDGDADALRAAAHKLAGMAAMFSSTAGALALDLEAAAAEGRLDDARPILARLLDGLPILSRRVERTTLESLTALASRADAAHSHRSQPT